MKNIVFDLGRVLIDFSLDPLIAFLQQESSNISSPEQFIKESKMHHFERGEICPDEFVSSLQELTKGASSKEHYKSAWNEIFTPVPEMLGLALDMRKDRKVFIISNTNKLHFDYILEKFNLERYADDIITSFEVGVMKPHPKIFDTACEKFGIKPEESIFIDDLKENVDAAINLGWNGVHHTKPELTIEEFKKRNIY